MAMIMKSAFFHVVLLFLKAQIIDGTSEDLLAAESKFSNRGFVKFDSEEDSRENTDGRLFTVGAQLSVSEGDSVPRHHHTRKNIQDQAALAYLESKFKPTTYLNSRGSELKDFPMAHRIKPKFTKGQMFKPIRSELSTDLEVSKIPVSNIESHTFEKFKITDVNPLDFKQNFQLQSVPNLYVREGSYRDIASEGQIEQYLEDQQKYRDEVLKLQLLNDPSPQAKGRYHQFLKAKEDEKIEKEYIESLKRKPVQLFQRNTNYAPIKKDRSGKRLNKKFQKEGLRNYRTPSPGSYSFEIEI